MYSGFSLSCPDQLLGGGILSKTSQITNSHQTRPFSYFITLVSSLIRYVQNACDAPSDQGKGDVPLSITLWVHKWKQSKGWRTQSLPRKINKRPLPPQGNTILTFPLLIMGNTFSMGRTEPHTQPSQRRQHQGGDPHCAAHPLNLTRPAICKLSGFSEHGPSYHPRKEITPPPHPQVFFVHHWTMPKTQLIPR